MSTDKRENVKPHPKEDNLEVQKTICEQDEGQRKEANGGDHADAVALGRLLTDLEFPANRKKIIHVAQLKEPIIISKAKKDELLNVLYKNLHEAKQYRNISEVAEAAGFVQ